MEVGQEALANAVGVSVQAVSKWETGQSVPDVGIIPDIAAFFGVSIDSLFYDKKEEIGSELPFPDDDVLYIVQVRNGSVLDKDKWSRDSTIKLSLENTKEKLDVQIWGSAEIKGDVSGSVDAGEGVSCQNVGGRVNAGCGVSCGNVGGAVNAGDGISCGNVGGAVNAGDSVICGNVGGSVNAGDGLNCGNISGSVSTDGDIHCGEITDAGKISCCTLYAKGSIKCVGLECGGDIHTEEKLTL